jgi:hypothetical protein
LHVSGPRLGPSEAFWIEHADLGQCSGMTPEPGSCGSATLHGQGRPGPEPRAGCVPRLHRGGTAVGVHRNGSCPAPAGACRKPCADRQAFRAEGQSTGGCGCPPSPLRGRTTGEDVPRSLYTLSSTRWAAAEHIRSTPRAVRPRNGGAMFRYRLHSDGNNLGEATYAQMIHLGGRDPSSRRPTVPCDRRRDVRGGGRVAVRRATSGSSRRRLPMMLARRVLPVPVSASDR